MPDSLLDPMQFGERLKASRIAAGFSRAELAKRAGIGKTVLERYENGERLPQGTLPQLAEALRVDRQWLLFGREDHDLDELAEVIAEVLRQSQRAVDLVGLLTERSAAIEARFSAVEARLAGIEETVAEDLRLDEEIRARLDGQATKARSTKSS